MAKVKDQKQHEVSDTAPLGADMYTEKTLLFSSLIAHHPQIDLDTLQIARGLNISRLLLMTAADTVLRPHGLSWSKLFVMLWLRAAQDAGEDGLAPSTLSARLHLTRNTVSALLAGLEDQEFISRALDPDDKRRFVMQLTPAGASVTHTCAETLFADLNTIVHRIEPAQREILLTGLAQLQNELWCYVQEEQEAR